VHLRRTDSTNERARALAAAGAPDGTLVTAAEQTAAPPNSSLLMSLLLRSAPPLLPLAAAVAVCEVAGDRAQIKWPNDIVVTAPGAATQLRKLAGILIESRPQEGWAVLGIGVNVAVRLAGLPPDVRARAATMGGTAADVEPTLGLLLDALARWLAQSQELVLEAWRRRDALRGRAIAWGTAAAGEADTGEADTGETDAGETGGGATGGGAGASSATSERGTAMGIDGDGRLVVALARGGRTTLQAGEVHLTGALVPRADEPSTWPDG
jgi:BirA family biotin operon repressor/biotin-[acetyl-CoA-carboxylase] ligase